MATKTEFASKIGLIAATVGSAIGLGNVWRFPAETQANGGAAFLLIYVVCVLLLGVPVMLGEFALGRGGRSDAIGVFRRLSPGSRWWIVGAGGILSSYLILIFYMVVAGWTLEYLVASAGGWLYSSPETVMVTGAAGEADHARYTSVMELLLTDVWRPLIATWAVIALNVVILLRGVQKGIERLSNVLMPLLFLILIGLCVVAFTLPGAADGLRFFLSPDFSKITPRVVVNALGQTFFSLSLGMGILITYASYYPADTRLTKTAMTVALLSLLVALLMGCVIFPAVKTFGLENESMKGATLIFRDAAGSVRSAAAVAIMVVAVFRAAACGGHHIDGFDSGGDYSVSGGYVRYEAPQRSADVSVAAVCAQRGLLAVDGSVARLYIVRPQSVRSARHFRDQYSAPCGSHRNVSLCGMVRAAQTASVADKQPRRPEVGRRGCSSVHIEVGGTGMYRHDTCRQSLTV